METGKRRGRPSTGQSSAVRKLSQKKWMSNNSKIWLNNRVLKTWKELKKETLFRSDSDFAGHLLSLELKRLERLTKRGNHVINIKKKRYTPHRCSEVVTSTPKTKSIRCQLFSSLPSTSSENIDVDIENTDDSLSDLDSPHDEQDIEEPIVVNGSVIINKDYTFVSDSSDEESLITDNESGSSSDDEAEFDRSLSILDDMRDKSEDSDDHDDHDDHGGGDDDDNDDENNDFDLTVTAQEDDSDNSTSIKSNEPQEVQQMPFGPGRLFSRYEEAYKYNQELHVINSQKVIASVCKIMALFQRCQEPGCLGTVTVKTKIVGSTLEVWWNCCSDHKGKWSSSTEYEGLYANNFQFNAALLLSGNNQSKVELMCRFLNLECPSKASFFRCQKFYCIPAVENWWKLMRLELLAMIGDTDVVVGGDGQSDSPGHSAKYLTYFLMLSNQLKEYIIHIECLDKRECGGKSPNMEREALKRATNVLKNVLELREVVTDASGSIIKMMADEFKDVIHSLDVWHKAKNIRKCITKVAKLKNNGKIGQWTDEIINHFWFCCANCDRQEQKLKTLWISLLHHVSNEHEWLDGKCDHPPVDNVHSLPWFDRRDHDYKVLQEIVLNQRLLSTFKYYVNFRHTRMLESVNSQSLMYAPKRCAFGHKSFKARKMLTAIDYNYHMYRTPCQDETSGDTRVSRKYNQRTGKWIIKEIKSEKDYAYIPLLLATVFEVRKMDTGTMQDYMEMSATDPRRIAPTIAKSMPVPTKELLVQHKTRFLKNEKLKDCVAPIKQ